MENIISYSLYGGGNIYHHGAIRNAQTIKYFFPEFVARFYVGDSIPSELCESLKSLSAEVIRIHGPETSRAMLWRFLPAQENINIFLSRDCDCRFSEREVVAVREWMASKKTFHIMRDHPYHGVPILGGLWGCKGNSLAPWIRKIFDYKINDANHGIDQDFLADIIYPHVKKDSYIHDSFFMFELITHKFSIKRQDNHFVGEAFNENDISNNLNAIQALIETENSYFSKFILKKNSAVAILKSHVKDILSIK